MYLDISRSATFTFRIQKFPCPYASDSIRVHSRETRPTCCDAMLVYFSIGDSTRFCYVIGFENIQICCLQVIGFIVDLIFREPIGIGIRCRICQMHMDDFFPEKEKAADSKIYGYMWMVCGFFFFCFNFFKPG